MHLQKNDQLGKDCVQLGKEKEDLVSLYFINSKSYPYCMYTTGVLIVHMCKLIAYSDLRGMS